MHSVSWARPESWLVAAVASVVVVGTLGLGALAAPSLAPSRGVGGGTLEVRASLTSGPSSSPFGSVITTIDLVNQTVLPGAPTVFSGIYTDMIAVDPVSGYLFVCNGDSENVTVLDPTTHAVLAWIPVPNGPWAVRSALPTGLKQAFHDFMRALPASHKDIYDSVEQGTGVGYQDATLDDYQGMIQMREAERRANRR